MRHKLGYATGIALCITLAVAMAAPQKAGGKGDAAKGKEVLDNNGCAMCHNIDSPEAKAGPTLQGLFKRKTLLDGKPLNDASVMDRINNGKGIMPKFGDQIEPADKTNLLAYLHTL